MEVTRIFDLLENYRLKYQPKPDVLAGKTNGNWEKYSIDDYISQVNRLSYAFLHMNVQKGDKIASIVNNSPEWNFLDMAIMQIGAVHVPIYPTISEEEYQYILHHAKVKYVFVSGGELYQKISHIIHNVPTIQEVFTIRVSNGFRNLQALFETGDQYPEPERLKDLKASIQADDLATLIYTSGTTGVPKGVMLSHTNLISNFKGVSYIPRFGEEGRALSFLPLCHVYERMLNYLYQYLGISIYYAESMAKIVDNAREIKPYMMTAVPRFLEKVYDKIEGNGRKLGTIKRVIFFWAVRLAHHYEINGQTSWWYRIRHQLADYLVFSKWRAALGGNFQIIVSGGAAIQPRLARVFWAAGIPVYEGYGLTETSPVIAVTSTDHNGVKFGTVGPPLRGVEVKIADDGEVLCKGPNIMLGYFEAEELTREVIDEEGWFHTGDIGQFEPEGQLRITGRKKEIFKTSLGKFIKPQLVENKIKASPFIDNIMVVGENQKFAGALVVPDFSHLRSWCAIKGVEYSTNEEMVNVPRIKQRIQREVKKFNADLGKTEQVKKFVLIGQEWSVSGGELSPTLKLKRRVVSARYAKEIEELYT